MHLTRRLAKFPLGPDRTLICNALTGEISVVTDAGLDALEALGRGERSDLDESALAALLEHRLLFRSPGDEEEFFAALCRSAWERFLVEAPRHYTFVVNTHCNFTCPYCFESTQQRTVRSTLTPPQVDAAFAVIDAHDEQAPQVEIFGGEPLLPGTSPTLRYILSALRRRDGRATLQTNGFHLLQHLPLLGRYQDVVSQLQVTLDGPAPVHDRRRTLRGGRGTFDRIVTGLDALAGSELPIQVNVRTNVDRSNVGQLPALADLYLTKGWAQDPRFTFTAAPVDDRSGNLTSSHLLGWDDLFDAVFPLSTDTGGGPFDLSAFKVLGLLRSGFGRAAGGRAAQPFVPRVNFCEAVALKLLIFHPDDAVYPCPEVLGRPEFAIGTYFPRFALDEAKAERWHRQTVLDRDRCHECPISTMCGGGCTLAALRSHGATGSPNCEGALDLVAAWVGHLRKALA